MLPNKGIKRSSLSIQDLLDDTTPSKKARANAEQDENTQLYNPSTRYTRQTQGEASIGNHSNPLIKAANLQRDNQAIKAELNYVLRPQTPPPNNNITFQRNEKTPGRIGPILPDVSKDYDIASFKGVPGKKVRKTAHEKAEEYKQHIRGDPEHTFHQLYVCYDKGPNGSPTYDKQGFELDYEKVAEWMKPRPYNKRRMINRMERALDRAKDQKERMAKVFFEEGAAPESAFVDDLAWRDRVSKDIGVPFHKIGVEHFEQWERMGFPKAKKGEYENLTKEQRDRLSGLSCGASLRK